MGEYRDLDDLVEAARLSAASARSDEVAEAAVVRLLADRGGFLPLADLLRAGAQRDVVARLVDDEAQADKRKRAKVRLGFIEGVPVAWMSSTGWASVGRPSAREMVPGAAALQHATSPSRLLEWLDTNAAAWTPYGASIAVTWGASCRRWSETTVAAAWGRIRTAADPSGALGTLTGGLVPDLLLRERWVGQHARTYFSRAWGLHEPDVDQDDLAETVVAGEVEDTKKHDDALRPKLRAWAEATENLQVARAVVWFCRTREVADRLQDLGVGSDRAPTQYLVAARDVGLGGEDLGVTGRPWWPLTITASQLPGAASKE